MPMGKYSKVFSTLLNALPFILLIVLIFSSQICFADFNSALNGVKRTLTGTVLPALSVIGLVLAAISFFSGNPMAKQHIIYAILGCCFGFGAQAISDLIRDTVR